MNCEFLSQALLSIDGAHVAEMSSNKSLSYNLGQISWDISYFLCWSNAPPPSPSRQTMLMWSQ